MTGTEAATLKTVMPMGELSLNGGNVTITAETAMELGAPTSRSWGGSSTCRCRSDARALHDRTTHFDIRAHSWMKEKCMSKSGANRELGTSIPLGEPLDERVRADMEALFGAEFGGVRIHVGAEAAVLGAAAFACGDSVYFAPGQYAPRTLVGQRLIAHELTHVLQQRQGRVAGPVASNGVALVDDPELEAEADWMARRVDAGVRTARPRQCQQERAPATAPAAVIQPKLVINGRDYTAEYKNAFDENNKKPQQEILNTITTELLEHVVTQLGRDGMLRGGLRTMSSQMIVEQHRQHVLRKAATPTGYVLTPQDHEVLNPYRLQIAKWVVDAYGLGFVFGTDKVRRGNGRYPRSNYGRKEQDRAYPDHDHFAKGLVGWVNAKPGRQDEKVWAHQVYNNKVVNVYLNAVLDKLKRWIQTLSDAGLKTEEEQKSIIRELQKNTTRSGDKFGHYWLSFMGTSPHPDENHPEEMPKELIRISAKSMMEVLFTPEEFSLDEKIIVLHDLMEYFGVHQWWNPPSAGQQLLVDSGNERKRVTTSVNPSGQRNNQPHTDRGKLKLGTTATRDENDPGTRFARSHKIPVWSGQSMTALRMLALVDLVNATVNEKTALAWALASFWRLKYPHYSKFAYHTLHEVMDIAYNFGVPYSPLRRDASLSRLTQEALFADVKAQFTELKTRYRNLLQGLSANERRIWSGPGKEADERLAALDAAFRSSQTPDGIFAMLKNMNLVLRLCELIEIRRNAG